MTQPYTYHSTRAQIFVYVLTLCFVALHAESSAHPFYNENSAVHVTHARGITAHYSDHHFHLRYVSRIDSFSPAVVKKAAAFVPVPVAYVPIFPGENQSTRRLYTRYLPRDPTP
ncbi:MAG: hypothetical protein HYV29_01020 [Ignavibacteriales bacterium]|nr:hypothetical protein [Ignavibacteriales bacterium]